MKKLLLTSAVCHLTFYMAFSQITLNQSDVAGVGKQLTVAHDTLIPNSYNPGSSGKNQTWNFSTLAAHTIDTLTFTNPAWLPNGAKFPNANLAIMNSTDGSEIYLDNLPSGLLIEGIYGDPTGTGATSIQFNPKERLAVFVDTFNTSFQDTSKLQFEFPFTIPQLPTVDSVRVKRTTMKDVKTDGSGTITTPLGTNNCLRHRGQVITIDSVFLHNSSPSGWFPAPAPYDVTIDTLWHFSWWANGKGYSLLEFDSTHADTIRNIQWLKTILVAGAVHETTTMAGAVAVYPNPATAQVNFEITNADASAIEIFDVGGNKMALLPTYKNKITYSAESLAQGTYIYRALDAKGNVIGAGKFDVMK